jgi:hypothetical protein
MDKQQIGLIGKHILIANLIAANLEVAEPLRDRGIDLIAFRDDMDGGEFEACPIQLKTASDATFSLDEKYERFSELRIVYVWGAENPANASIFALTYQQAKSILEDMKFAKSPTWENTRKYTQTRPSKVLKDKLKDYLIVDPIEWPKRLGMKESSVASTKSNRR